MKLHHFPALSGARVNVIVETPKSSGVKYSYDPGSGLFLVSEILASGPGFPVSTGFIPSTNAEGVPLDVLILSEEACLQGWLLKCDLLGVIEDEHSGHRGEWIRSDRILVVPEESNRGIGSLDDPLIRAVERFLVGYHLRRGRHYRIVGRFGRRTALKFVKQSLRRTVA